MALPTKETELDKKLAQIREHGTEDQYKALALKYKLPYSDLATAPVDTSALLLVPEDIARKSSLAVILKSGTALTVAILDPENEETKTVLEGLEARKFLVSLIVTNPKALETIWARYGTFQTDQTFEVGSIDVKEDKINNFQQQIQNLSDLKSTLSRVSTTELLEILIAGGLKTHASDVHFEPETASVRLRYRLDGVLNDITTIETKEYQKLVNRIKVLSRLKINVHNTPQDGRFTIRLSDVSIEVRVSVLPSEYGETIVMRLLDPRSIQGSLEDLGIRPEILTVIKSQLDKPTGAILTTGPTGSGKTTTLYAFVTYLNSSGSKIITIEDPIEYNITGISQTQVDPSKGYDFANGLKAIVRQDPDIILVGEIRDTETAEIALQAALTGHLVLSTIHTNDAAGTIPRLINLKVAPQVIAPAIHVAMAQRLLRKLCVDCRKKQPLTTELKKKLHDELDPIKDRIKMPEIDSVEIFVPGKCKECNETGYKGRTGVYEAFLVTPEIEKLVLAASPSISDIQALAVSQGMITMHQDAYVKLLEGITSEEEIQRILG